ncbi:MAG: carboxy terminal-processing peptidase [Nitrospiraceae bacterium]|nr:carboxy terminal-processing peptidase [Nitrospiraceae bacterium]
MMTAGAFLRSARSVAALVLCLLFINLPASYALESRNTPAYQRAKVLGYLLSYDLGNLHFSHKKIDDELSKNAFTLYMKQLDSQKRFFLKEDVKKLAVYTNSIDDEIKSGNYELADLATAILLKRAAAVKEMVRQLLSKDFNFAGHEYVETDPEKLDYCETEGALRERWRKILELQVLHQLLNMEDEAKKPQDGKDGMPTAPFEKTAREKVLRSYETFFSELRERSEREEYERYFNSLTRAYDPHTEYMPPSSKEDFDISMRGTLEGIGATLREEDGYIKVVEIVPGSPAFRQGQLQPEDIILKVAEKDKEPVDITYMGVQGAVKLIRGKKGTEVRLTIKKPSGSRMVVPIVRDVIKLEDNFVKSAVLKDGAGGAVVGYIKIPAFYRDFDHTGSSAGRNCTDDVKKELNKLKAAGIRGLILDLRNDGGGALTDAIKTAGLFIKTGPVVQVKASDGKISVLADEDPDIRYSGPMVVLVNKFSASASEILAGALQDYGRAIVIGGDTHGKGTVQTIIDLNDFLRSHDMGIKDALGALKITTQKFYRISGASTQYRGVKPDIVLPDQFQGLKTGEQYLDFALPWDTINPAAYSKWTNSRPDIRELRARSEKRVRANKEFADITKENEELIEMQKKTLQPLNIEEARKDEEELKEVTQKRDSGNPHGGIRKGKKQDTSHLSEEGRRQAWIKEVGEDPYVRESVSVLDDMRSPVKTSASN